jgi:primary-amine oxidase
LMVIIIPLKGDPIKLPNVICCHEVDDGIMWKRTKHRIKNATVAPSRMLMLQKTIMVKTYEYIFVF